MAVLVLIRTILLHCLYTLINCNRVLQVTSGCVPRSPCRKCKVGHSNRNGYCDKHQSLSIGWVKTQKNKTTTERGYGHAWRKLRLIILERDKHCCIPCKLNGFVVPAYAVDHIKPKEQGGTDAHDNLQSICKACHREKTQGEAIHGSQKWY